MYSTRDFTNNHNHNGGHKHMLITVKLAIRIKVPLLKFPIWHCILKFEVEKIDEL